MSEAPRVLAVVPVYDHAATLRAVVEGLLQLGLPVLVVDDGSADAPLDRLAGLPVETLRLERNRGKGAAILYAARRALEEGYDAILTLDADGQHYPSDAPALLKAAFRSWPAVAVGRRDMDVPNVPGSSRFGRAFSNFWVRLECGRRLEDSQSGFRVYPVSMLLETRYLSRRYTFEVEVLVRCAWAGMAIVEHPIRVVYQKGAERISHFRAFRDNLRLTVLHTFLVARSLLPRPGAWAKAREALRAPRAFLRGLATEHDSPMELAAAVGMGVFIGSLPIIPFGTAAIVFVNHRLGLNRLAGVGAANVCVAPFVPFLCVQAGHLMRTGHLWTAFNRQTLLREVHLRLGEWLLGSLVIGPLLGLALAVPTYYLVRRLRK